MGYSETLKKGDVVEFKLKTGGLGIGVIKDYSPDMGWYDILVGGELSDYRQYFTEVKQIKDLNVFDMIKEKKKSR